MGGSDPSGSTSNLDAGDDSPHKPRPAIPTLADIERILAECDRLDAKYGPDCIDNGLLTRPVARALALAFRAAVEALEPFAAIGSLIDWERQPEDAEWVRAGNPDGREAHVNYGDLRRAAAVVQAAKGEGPKGA